MFAFDRPGLRAYGQRGSQDPCDDGVRRGRPALHGTHVLLVEDETLIAMMLEEVPGDLGCEVIGPAARLDAAPKLAESERFDGALIDIDLRGHPAYPLADLLDARGVPFGFVTGYDADRVERRFRRGHPLLHKPTSPDQLRAALIAMGRKQHRSRIPATALPAKAPRCAK